MNFYLKRKGRTEIEGPITLNQMNDRLASGSVSEDDLVVEARGQSHKQLKASTEWKKVSTMLGDKEQSGAPKIEESKVEKIISKESDYSSGYKFKTLLGYGKFISGFGWFIIILSIISIIAALSSGEEAGPIVAAGLMFFIILGTVLVASGQLISCFVSIERNTRETYELLKKNK